MSLRTRLRDLLICMVVELGVLSGVPMQAKQLKELLECLNQPKLTHVLPSEEHARDDPR